MTTTNTQHTPGPWKVTIEPNRMNITVYLIRNKMGAEDGAEAEANRQLIARAPSLLKENEQLKISVEALEDSLLNKDVELDTAKFTHERHVKELKERLELAKKNCGESVALNAELLEALKVVRAGYAPLIMKEINEKIDFVIAKAEGKEQTKN